MNASILKLLILFNLFLVDAHGQAIINNTCDSTLLTVKEYQKCMVDSVYSIDILNKTNYIINFKTDLLPKYRVIRKSLSLPPTLQQSLQNLKFVYDTVLDQKLSRITTDMDKNQYYVQPKAYLSALLSLQIFKFYPDIHAILLNDIHLHLQPKTTRKAQKAYKQYLEDTLNAIPKDLHQELVKITDELAADNSILMQQGVNQLFQGHTQDEYRQQCNIINFLLWTM